MEPEKLNLLEYFVPEGNEPQTNEFSPINIPEPDKSIYEKIRRSLYPGLSVHIEALNLINAIYHSVPGSVWQISPDMNHLLNGTLSIDDLAINGFHRLSSLYGNILDSITDIMNTGNVVLQSLPVKHENGHDIGFHIVNKFMRDITPVNEYGQPILLTLEQAQQITQFNIEMNTKLQIAIIEFYKGYGFEWNGYFAFVNMTHPFMLAFFNKIELTPDVFEFCTNPLSVKYGD